MTEMSESRLGGSGRNLRGTGAGVSSAAAARVESRPKDEMLMEEAVEHKNLIAAYRRVVANKGSAGVEGMTVDELGPYLKENWPRMQVF